VNHNQLICHKGESAILPLWVGYVTELLKKELKVIQHGVPHCFYQLDICQKADRYEEDFICTHNSRRSHIAQLWAQAVATYYRVENVQCFSGGTEATAFNPRAVKAMKEIGFRIKQLDESSNPKYEVSFSETENPLLTFSKVHNDSTNPSHGFAAIITCSHADQNCPLVIGTEARISLPYEE
jgi:arsenate reductase